MNCYNPTASVSLSSKSYLCSISFTVFQLLPLRNQSTECKLHGVLGSRPSSALGKLCHLSGHCLPHCYRKCGNLGLRQPYARILTMPLTIPTTLSKIFKFAKYGFFICKIESVISYLSTKVRLYMGSTLEGTRPRSCPLTAPFHFSTCVLQTAYQCLFPYKKLYDSILVF